MTDHKMPEGERRKAFERSNLSVMQEEQLIDALKIVKNAFGASLCNSGDSCSECSALYAVEAALKAVGKS